MTFLQRTHSCGSISTENIGETVILNGWVAVNRDMGKLIFVDVRDRFGITQAVFLPEENPELADVARKLRQEFVVAIKGKVRMRENPNPKIPTGLIEIVAEELEIINRAELPPFEISDDILTNEELRLKYRFLDLRRPKLQRNFIIRNQAYQIAHRYFAENGFLEIETPVLTKSTPEGARDYLVPSRIHHGKFYALPQSPQLYKQLLMIAGFDRYMQIVKCFRDEDLRADRQPEFSQIDVEMSFVTQNDIIEIAENFTKRLWQKILGMEIQTPFPRMTYDEAMTRFGSDKPDLRYGLELTTLTETLSECGFSVFTDAIKAGGEVVCLNAEGCGDYSRKMLDELAEVAKKYGAKGLAWMKLTAEGTQSPIAKFLIEAEISAIQTASNAKIGDLLLFVANENSERSYTIAGALRTEIARRKGILESVKGKFSFHWVVEFPLLEFVPEENRYVARHHPFTAPMVEDAELLTSAPEKARAIAHDLVINGYETAGGSIRIHQNSVQQQMFRLLGISLEEAQEKFGFLLDALQYGAPPHGGIAYGLDRLIMILCGTDNIRDVIVFPKTTSAQSLMDNCPSEVVESQLSELGIGLAKK